jgi:DNA-binding response OmpR family regulator
MPGMDGFQLIRSLAASSFREGLEIVVVTGLDAAEVDARGGLPPDVRVFPKPVPFAELRGIAAGLLERRAAYL